MTSTLALDVGATKIGWGFVTDEDPTQAVALGKIPTQSAGVTPQEQIKKAIQLALEESSITPTRIGIGSPGIIKAPEGLVTYNGDTIKNWAGTNLRAVAKEIVDLPCAVHNDVRVWAYGELTLGAARDFQSGRVLYLSLGTGVGGAVSDSGRLLTGPTGSAGEFSELLCADFRGFADRAENIMSGNSLAAYYEEFSTNSASERVQWKERDQLALPLEKVVERMNQGDELASRIIRGNSYGLGRAVAGLVSALDLDAVVLGGGVCQVGAAVEEPFRQAIEDFALKPNRSVAVRITESPATAPLVGAAAFARDNAF
ncbi:ROK family protein [Corynebacterium aurimucosum]|uniref:ROK family protein n=1 Tax=Corynebacterium aurimucosum TaxID=169292 RepID=UPI0001BCEFCE|nr:ROK family protein [Corynebacterium aurimucosum]QQU93599.1 ROK family protein [Corynebacterium aurimucosum]